MTIIEPRYYCECCGNYGRQSDCQCGADLVSGVHLIPQEYTIIEVSSYAKGDRLTCQLFFPKWLTARQEIFNSIVTRYGLGIQKIKKWNTVT